MENDNGDSLIKNEFTVSLEGGRPWGFTLQGGVDFRSPLKVGKVRHFENKHHRALCLQGPVNSLLHAMYCWLMNCFT
jgi:hypothetical protein